MMRKRQAHVVEVQKKVNHLRPPVQKPGHPQGRTLVQPMAPQAAFRRVQTNPNTLAAADLRALQRAVGNRTTQQQLSASNGQRLSAHGTTYMVQQREYFQLQAKPDKSPQKAQQPPPGGTIAEGGALNDATITAVKDALKKATTKRYIVYKNTVKVGGTLAWRANNPGNLRDAPTKIARVPGLAGKFAVFATMDDGSKAQKDLYLKTYGEMKVRDAVAKLTPTSENDTKRYLQDLKKQGVDLDGTVKSQIDTFMDAVQKNEGMQEGIEVPRAPD